MARVTRHLRRTAVLAIAVAALSGAAAVAYFTATGTGSANASVGSLGQPNLPAPTPGPGTVDLSWSSVSPPSGSTAVKYYVTRGGGTVGGTCPSSAATATTSLSCQDDGLTKGTYTYTIVAVWMDWTRASGPQTATVASGPAAKLAFTTQPVGGVPESTNLTTMPSVSVEDAQGNVVTSDSSTITLAINTYAAGNGGSAEGNLSCSNTDGLSPSASSGVANFTGCQITGSAAAGNYTLTATDGGLTSATSSSFGITAGSASQLLFTAQPVGGVTEGTNFNTSPTVMVEDPYGNVATGDNGPVTLSVNSYNAGASGGTSAGNLSCSNPGGLSPNASSGVATFAGCQIAGTAAAGTYTLKATRSGITGTGASNNVTIKAGNASQLTFTTQPVAGVPEGTDFGTSPSVSVEDSFSNVVTSDTGSITLAINSGPGSGSLSCANSGGLNPNAAAGVATFTGCQVTGTAAAGSYTLKATRAGLTSATSNSLTIKVGSANQLAFTTEPVGGVTEGTNFATSPAVSVEDAFSNVVTADAGSVTLAVNSGPGSGSLSCSNAGGLSPSATAGVATFSGCQITGTAAAGTYTLKASRTGLATGTSGNLTINPGTATKLAFTTQPVGGVAESTNLATMPSVSVEDANSNVVTSDSSTVTLAVASYTAGGGGSAQGSLSCTNSGFPNVSATNGVVNFTGCQITGSAGAGTYTVKATDGSLTNTTSNSFAIVAGSLASFKLSNSATETAGSSFSETLTALDSSGNTVTGYSGSKSISWSGPASSPNGTAPSYPSTATSVSFSAGQGTATGIVLYKATSSTTLTATSGGTSGNATFAVNSAGVTLTLTPAGTTTFNKGQTKTFTIEVPNDAYGNAFTSNAGLPVSLSLSNTSHFSLSGSPITITTGPANNTFTVTENGNDQGANVTLSASVAAPFTSPASATVTETG